MHSPFIDVILMCIGFLGFLLAFYIFHRKHEPGPLVCPLKSNCDKVVHSDYSKFLGVHIEIWGMIYYSIVILFHASAVLFPVIYFSLVVYGMLSLSAFAFLFSMYLTGIQAFVLREWCTWCLSSAFLCVSIFVITFFFS